MPFVCGGTGHNEYAVGIQAMDRSTRPVFLRHKFPLFPEEKFKEGWPVLVGCISQLARKEPDSQAWKAASSRRTPKNLWRGCDPGLVENGGNRRLLKSEQVVIVPS